MKEENINNRELKTTETNSDSELSCQVMRQPKQDLFGNIVIKSIGFNETEIIENILHLHSKNEKIDLDPTYSIGNFYNNKLPKPKYRFDKDPQCEGVLQADAGSLPLGDSEIETIMFDPPFLFRDRPSEYDAVIGNRFTLFKTYDDLLDMYQRSLVEFHRILKPKGIVIFKCQDMTDNKSYFTHCEVLKMAEQIGFIGKDLFILLARARQYHSEQQQRHARKFHSYFWVLQKVQNAVAV